MCRDRTMPGCHQWTCQSDHSPAWAAWRVKTRYDVGSVALSHAAATVSGSYTITQQLDPYASRTCAIRYVPYYMV